MPKLGFIAYADGHSIVAQAIEGAVELAKNSAIALKSWKAMDIIGFTLDDQVRSNLKAADLVVADITYPNINVFYEMGHAIAIGKPLIPSVNKAVEKASQRVIQLGLFDTIGWAGYTNSTELLEQLQQPPGPSLTTYQRRKNHSQPLFILDVMMKTDFRQDISNASKILTLILEFLIQVKFLALQPLMRLLRSHHPLASFSHS